MWDIDHFPGADHVPWPLLIRARFVHQIDAVLASVIVNQVGAVASAEVTRAVARAAHETIGSGRAEDVTPEQRVAAFDAVLDFDDWCPTRPRHPWPWPGPRPRFEELSDPIAEVVLQQAYDLVQRAGSEDLKKTLGSTLAEYSSIG